MTAKPRTPRSAGQATPEVVPAPVGLKYTAKRFIPASRQAEQTVGAKCETNRGFWYCVTCDESFQNQFEKDSHVSPYSSKRKTHTLAWVCYEHGPETP